MAIMKPNGFVIHELIPVGRENLRNKAVKIIC
jgi:hypothetical protein